MKKRMFCALLVLVLVMCLMPAALADDKADSNAAETLIDIENAAINGEDETYYNNGDTVFNNGGTVFNNSGIVFNNGGVVFNNGGTVYNNGGMVYNNSGTVYNNGGVIEDNTVPAGAVKADAKPTEKADTNSETETEAETETPAEYRIAVNADYSDLITVDGMERDSKGGYIIEADAVGVIRPVFGVTITEATTTAGACTLTDDGSIQLERVDRDGKLTLKFKTDAPTITPASGSYGDDVEITINAPDGADIYYTTNGASPTKSSTKYTKPFEIEKSTTIKAIAIIEGAKQSDTVEESYVFPAVSDVDFGKVSVGYSEIEAMPVVVKNTGLAKLKIIGAALAGDDKDSFTLSTEKGATIATGQSNEKTWLVTPKTGLRVGEYEAEVVFILDSGDSVEADVKLSVVKPENKKA